MEGYGKKRFLKKVFISLCIMASVELSVTPSSEVASIEGHSFVRPEVESTEKYRVLSVLSGYRTGLGLAEKIRLSEVILEESRNYNLDPLFVLALIETESTYYNWAKSRKGAVGLMQVRPGTGRHVADELNIRWEGERTLYNPYLNVKLGLHYFATLLERYGDDRQKALAAYNSGPGYVTARLRLGRPLPRRYGSKVMSKYENLKERIAD